MSIMSFAKTCVSRSGLILRKYAPEILTGTGILLEVFAVGSAMKAGDKAHPILEDHRAKLVNINDNTVNQMVIKDADNGEIAPVNAKKEKAKLYLSTAGKLTRVYWPAMASTVASVACFGASLGIMRFRTAALTTAYTLAEANLKNYRERVAGKLGEGEERDLFYGTETVTTEETGTKKIVKKEFYDGPNKPREYSQYARFFDCGNSNWSDIPEYNLMFLKQAQNWANDKLNAQGHLFLNEVYDYLDIDRSKAGAIVGWLKTKDGSTHNFVDFGIFRGESIPDRMFVNGEEPVFLLDFNVDGVIYDLLEQNKD